MGRETTNRTRAGGRPEEEYNNTLDDNKGHRDDDKKYRDHRPRRRNQDDDDERRTRRQRRHDDDDQDHKRRESISSRNHRPRRRRSESDSSDDNNKERHDRRSERRSRESRHRSKSKKRKRRNDREDEEEDSRKKKHHKKKRHRGHDDYSDESDSEKKKKNRRRDDDDKTSSHRRKHHKEKSTKGKTKDKENRPDRPTTLRSNPPPKDSLVDMGSVLGHAPSPLLDENKDYFAYHSHFSVYLYRRHGWAFYDLPSSDDTRRVFREFVHEYNAGRLERGYYKKTLLPEILQQVKTTRHAWNLGNDDINNNDKAAVLPSHCTTATTSTTTRKQSSSRRSLPNARDRWEAQQLELAPETMSSDNRQEERTLQRRHGRAATGGGRRQEDPELRDQDLYDTNQQDEKQALLDRSQRRTAAKQQAQTARLAAWQAKEPQTQAQVLEQLGLAVPLGHKITIAPRKDDPTTSNKK